MNGNRNQKPQPFKRRGRAFIKKVLRIRKHLIKMHVNQIPEAPEIVDEIQRLLNYWPYDTNRKMASFILCRGDQLYKLIPGKNCTAHESLMKEWQQVMTEARQIYHGLAAAS